MLASRLGVEAAYLDFASLEWTTQSISHSSAIDSAMLFSVLFGPDYSRFVAGRGGRTDLPPLSLI